ncbi:MAG: glucose-6-phosphate dehydrogenase [Bacteroidales bacterium]|nr:glucose-6-phosphate dehydrogenase [Bacteroidales bacterium]
MKSSIMVIFGGSGDLTKRKLMPSLFNLFKKGRLTEDFKILAAGRTENNDETFRASISESLKLFLPQEEQNEAQIEKFLEIIFCHAMDPSNMNDYESLKVRLFDIAGKKGDYLYYLATPPSLYEIIPLCLKSVGLNTKNSRVIVEKPFGYDLESAKRVNSILKESFEENQIYRIDHFLGKETVQNILAFRFANGIFEPLWNRNYIDRVEITAVENLGIGDRGRFYDSTGALRDMVQNHLIQLLALVAMEPPVAFNESEFRNEVVKVYKSLAPIKPGDIPSSVVRGQYIASERDGGRKIKGYREEKNVHPDSHTETFLALKLFVSNWRWDGVPFYIRTGKQMPTKVSEIVVYFRPTPHKLFSSRQECPEQNQLIIRIQPNEGAVLKFDIKVPGSGFDVKQVPMEFTYDKLGGLPSEDAYSKLIEDCMNGESVLFTRSDAVEASWAFFDPIIEMWKNSKNIPLYGYPAGTWGPLESNAIIEGGKNWTNPCKNLIDTDLYCEL